MPPAGEVLAFARDQLPLTPIRMSGSLKHRAPNGFVLADLAVEMELDGSRDPATAVYRLRDVKTGREQRLQIVREVGGPLYHFTDSRDASAGEEFNPDQPIGDLGVTWADLSFSFLWSESAETVGTARRLGRDCFVLSIPRPDDRRLVLWIEQETGRMLGAREESVSGQTLKEIRVVSVKQFDGLWMIKDLDVIHPQSGHRTGLRIDEVEAVGP